MSRTADPKKLARLFYAVIYRISISRTARESLIFLLELEQQIYSLTGTESCRYGGGIHSKHRHTHYHDFFLKHISPGERVLDIGCGNGALAYDLAQAGALVTAMDGDADQIRFAGEHFIHPHIQWLCGKAPQEIPAGRYHTIVLSNVLEHVEDRIGFLKAVKEKTNPSKWLMRVPLYERDWRVPLMEELGVDYRLDQTHCIEYTQESFGEELRQSGLIPLYLEIRWGEIWSVAGVEIEQKE